MKKYILMLFAGLTLVSCMDTIILPDDKTVDEDFWKSKEDVAMMVNGAYAAMTTNDVLERLIVWGDFRTDEVNRNNSVTDISTQTQSLDEIAAVNIQTTNAYATWSAFYEVINRCNIVLTRASEVLGVDPNYTDGDYQVDRSQMLALRALCYFYLVRNFRDVPYYTEAYMTSSQATDIPQSSPAYIINQCISDLEGCVSTSMSSRSFNDCRRVGWFTTDGINALLADLYLWRASVMHSAADYQSCIDICDRIIESKKSQHTRKRTETTEAEYPLAEAEDMYYDLFVKQNAEESIFELQCLSNLPVCQYYWKYKSATGSAGMGWFKATTLFGGTASIYNTETSVSNNNLYSATDLRYYAACYLPTSSEDSYDIRKIISENRVIDKTATKKREEYAYGGMDRNYIIYRLTDVMLMKAEALVQQAADIPEGATDEEKESINASNASVLRPAFNMIQAVNARALYRDDKGDSLKWNAFKGLSKLEFERLILQERLREFCFEGRRWYDLLRYNYRHVEGTDYNSILADQGALVKIYDDMLELMTRKRGTEASGVKAKMQNEAYLYLPIPNRDIQISPQLRQNPAYGDSNEYEKKY